jgi:hypothetical protein
MIEDLIEAHEEGRMETTLLNLINQNMADDDDDGSVRILEAFNGADAKTSAVIDDIFISLCGWSLTTLISQLQLPEGPEEDNSEHSTYHTQGGHVVG